MEMETIEPEIQLYLKGTLELQICFPHYPDHLIKNYSILCTNLSRQVQQFLQSMEQSHRFPVLSHIRPLNIL